MWCGSPEVSLRLFCSSLPLPAHLTHALSNLTMNRSYLHLQQLFCWSECMTKFRRQIPHSPSASADNYSLLTKSIDCCFPSLTIFYFYPSNDGWLPALETHCCIVRLA
ncbi:hypothetical protein EDC01DRAFT_221517 [Geopyxis carbonaria]|nr:hypothetical protein EDC01DRAFT_221517 [Geopyxis carbonaria]